MAHEPTKKMIETPHINVLDHCRKCEHLLAAKNKSTDEVDWGTLRNACRCCKTGQAGIYKADAIFDLYELETELKNELAEVKELLETIKLPKRNVGKKATRYKTHGKAVRHLREQGLSLRLIASFLQISVNTVRSILAEQEDTDENR